MTEAAINLMVPTYPRSVQPGIPRLSAAPKGWSSRRFGDLLKVVQRPVRMADEGEYDLVTVKRSRGGIESRGRFRGRDISVKSQFALEGGDFLISKRQIVHGACAVVPEEFAGSIVSNEYSVLRCKPGLDLGFLRYLSYSVYFQQTCFHSSTGVHVEKMIFKLEDWLKFRVNVPPLEEQKRIAAGFEAVDAKLAALREKADGLNHFKAGLMQRLFSQELRFTREDGSDFPDWEEKPLGKMGRFTGGGTPDTNNKSYWSGDVAWVSSSDLSEGNVFHLDIKRRITHEAIKSSATQVTPKGAVLIVTRVGIGKCCISPEDVCTSQDFTNFVPADGIGEFFAYWLLFNQGRLKALAQGTSIKGITVQDLKSLNVEVPHPDEQRNISDALMAVDAKIDAVADQITHMESFKKALLQKMFV